MNLWIALGILVFLKPAVAGISYGEKPKSEAQKSAEQVKQAVSGADLSGINARLRVEGAAFRPFSLYLAPTKMATTLTAAQKKMANDIRAIIDRDLNIVGGFNFITHSVGADEDALMRQKGAEGVSRLTLSFQGPSSITLSCEHKNFITGKVISKSFYANALGLRKLSHLVAQNIYESFIGPEDIFHLQIAAIKRDVLGSQVVLLDFDGHNETAITDTKWMKSSPYFSPDGKSILYTVISADGQGIVEQEIGSKHFQFRLKKPGLNIDPRMFPDKSAMLATLTFENNANIYRVSKTGTIIGKVTNGLGQNLSPTLSFDAKEMAFVSDRSGTPQVYVQALDKPGPAQRLTFQGNYNQTPHFSPDAKWIAFTGRDEKKVFDIFILERSSGVVSRVTENQGRNQEPHFSPSGRFVIFTSEREGKLKPDIFISSLNGSHQYRITDANSDKKSLGYFSPVVRPRQQQP